MSKETNEPEGITLLDETLLSLLACPACDDRPPLRQEGNWLVCDACTRRYPIRDGLPEILVESAVLPTRDA
jgi:uncharacterized protein